MKRLFLGFLAFAFSLASLRADSVSACSYSGNAGAQIASAIAALPSGAGGTVDARCQSGTLQITSTISADRPVQILLAAGTYSSSVSSGPIFSLQAAGSALTGVSPQATIIVAGGNENGVDMSADTTVKSLTLRGHNVAQTTYASGINSGGSSTAPIAHMRVENAVIEQWGNMGINTGAYSSQWKIANCTVRDNLSNGIFIAGPGSNGAIVSGNSVTGNLANGIDTNSDFTTITNNYLFNNGNGTTTDQYGIYVGGASYCTVTGNIVVQSRTKGIYINGGSGTANYNVVSSNTVRGGCGVSSCTYQDGISVGGSGSGSVTGTLVIGNTVTGVTEYGILVDGARPTAQTRIIGNNSNDNAKGIYLDGSNVTDATVALNTTLGNTSAAVDDHLTTRTQQFLNKISTSTANNSPYTAPFKLDSDTQTELHISSSGSGYGSFKFYLDNGGGIHLYDQNNSADVFSMKGSDVAFLAPVGVSGTNARIYSGSGAPTSSAPTGSIYLRTDGGTGTTLYVRENGVWRAATTQ